MHLSGINYCDREEFLSALAEVSGVAGSRVREKLGSLYSRYAEEWDAIIPHVQILPAQDNKPYTHDRKVVSVS